jgi:predicted acyl esterase
MDEFAPVVVGTKVDDWITMRDGVRLSISLYLPDPAKGPQPCVLEALPYRKDDMTSSYRPEYTRLRDEYSYAIARLDVRGTGSSAGRATDEYPYEEQKDLAEVIAWLASQPWCSGNVGMYGTSYSGFNSLQMAAERPPALKAVIAIYATDDRFEDDVHLMGGSLRWLDLVDYCHYMTPMNALPPVPAVWGEGWRTEWAARIAEHEPWLFTWLDHQRRDDYWQHGSIRPGYSDVECAVMLVAGWADGYRNNSFRTIEALAAQGTPHSLLVGPWAHASTATSTPGPRIDLVPEMVSWWDRWLREIEPADEPPTARWYAQESHVPQPDLDLVPGVWRADNWPSPRSSSVILPIAGRAPYAVIPDVGTSAWNSCAGHLPWGQPTDQRYDDAASLTWEWPQEQTLEIAGYSTLRLQVSASEPVASVGAKLCDVGPDGTSTLITRTLLNLTRRGGTHTAEPLVPGQIYDVELTLEAAAWRLLPGQLLRLSIAGVDWPNTVAPPRPLTLTIHGGELMLPLYDATDLPFLAPTFTAGDEFSSEDVDGTTWSVTRNVLRRRTTGTVDHGGPYDTTYGSANEHYQGSVSVDTRTWDQEATADINFILDFEDDGSGQAVKIQSTSTMVVRADARDFHVEIELICREGDRVVGERSWRRTIPRDLA